MSTFFHRLFRTSRVARKHIAHASRDRSFAEVVARTAGMVRDGQARSLVRAHGLDLLDLTWEDTGRYHGSSVGPNISDMTIQVASDGVRGASVVTCMPVIRFPNFTDRTADVSIDDVKLRVGNERGEALRSISLRDYLRDLRAHLSRPASWAGAGSSLLAPREREVLVSAQACFLPVPASGMAEFNPVLFNYQSHAGAPAVLAIVATREGTSATIIDNQRDGFGAGRAWGQRLFFNQNGERASFAAARMAEFVAAGGDETDRVSSPEAARDAGLSCVMLIQVPLVRPDLARASAMAMPCSSAGTETTMRSRVVLCEESDVDEAVIGHGEVEGPFTEIDGLAIERDPRFPIRVTVQFYKATSNGIVSPGDIETIAAQIASVYADAKAVGSLVVDPESGRSTTWDDEGKGKAQPHDWWERFWRTQEVATGKSRLQLVRELERLLGRTPTTDELEAAIRRVFFDT